MGLRVLSYHMLKIDDAGKRAAQQQQQNPLPDEDACANPEIVWLESLRSTPNLLIDRMTWL